MNLYIGLDAHSTTSTFFVINQQGKEVLKTCVPTSEQNLRSVLKSLNGKKYLTFEESNLSKWLYSCIKPEVDQLLICAPQYFLKKPGAKTDLRDSHFLAKELRNNNLIEVYRDDRDELLQLRSLVSSYNNLIQDIVRSKNRFKALFRSQAITHYKAQFYNSPNTILLLKDPQDQFIADHLMYQIHTLQEIKSKYLNLFLENTQKYKTIKNLTTIPGINIVRANQIAAITGSPQRFKNKHKYWSYSMLIRHKQISNSIVYGKKQAHGRTELKNIFLGTALSQISGSSTFANYYQQLIEQGVKPKQARLKMAQKTVAITLAIMKKNKKYQNNWSFIENLKK